MKVEELNLEKCWKILERKRFGRLACSLDNQPYIVPLNFVFDGKQYLYAFSTVGQKIRWMRENPLVCIELDEIKEQNDWTTLVVYGSYEELPDTSEFRDSRVYAHKLLSKYPMWWQPAYVSDDYREQSIEEPVYFRIYIKKITGHRTVSENQEFLFQAKTEIIDTQRNRFWGLW